MTPAEKTAIIEAAFADVEKTAFEAMARAVAIQVFENGEPVDKMKAGLEATVIQKHPGLDK